MSMRVGTWLQRRYRVGPALGSGGAATTYAGHDRVFDRAVAIKVLHQTAPELRAALFTELQRLRGVVHPALVRVHDVASDTIDGTRLWFLVTDMIHGRSLTDVAMHGTEPPTWEQLREPICDVLSAVEFLHQLGTRHGDLKPDNILITDHHRGVVIDLGCARPLNANADPSPSGTLAWMAPELLSAQHADGRADVFALGKSLLSLPIAYPSAVRDLLTRMCQPAPEDRPGSMGEVLERWSDVTRPRWSPGIRSPRLLERDAIVDKFHATLTALIDQQPAPRVFWITGPNLVGRTRLMDELKWHAQQHCTVVVGAAHQASAVNDWVARLADEATTPQDLPSVLAARDRAAASLTPIVAVLDDVHALPEPQRQLLMGILRTTATTGSVLWLLSSTSPPDVMDDGTVDTHLLSPLTEASVHAWTAGRLSAAEVSGLHRLTGGYPGYIQAALDRLAAETLRASDLTSDATPDLGLSLDVGACDVDQQRVLAWLCAAGHVTRSAFEDSGLLDAAIVCAASAWVKPTDNGFVLHRDADAQALRDALPQQLMRDAHRRLEQQLVDSDDDADQERRLHHLAYAGDFALARGLLPKLTQRPMLHPRQLLAATLLIGEDALVHLDAKDRSPLLLAVARVTLAAGEPKLCLQWLARLLRQRPPAVLLDDARCIAAGAYNQLGMPARAVRQLQRAVKSAVSERQGDVAERLARALLQQGHHEEARDVATRALPLTTETSVVANLHECVGIAHTMRDEYHDAALAFDDAEHLHPASDPRARFRCLSHRAMLDFRAGRPRLAARRYAEALRIAEQHGLADLYVNAALNLGSTAHTLGDWGAIVPSYERAIELARALGKQSTLAALLFNLANLYTDAGAYDRAEVWLNAARRVSQQAVVHRMTPYVTRLAGEIAFGRGRSIDATHLLEDALRAFQDIGAQREVTEVHLERARQALSVGNQAACDTALALAESLVTNNSPDDLRARVLWLRARRLFANGDARSSRELLDSALTLARRSEQRLLCADILSDLAAADHALGDTNVADAHRAEARAHELHIASGLPSAVRDAFLTQPHRRDRHAGSPTSSPAQSTADPARHGFDLSGFLEINRRINSSLTVDQVLSHAMDAAIALTGAERGFLLLTGSDGDVDVSVARNVDREHLGRAHTKFSRSIAEEVMRTEAPILTVDAGSDNRFSSQDSVHAMKLKSVVCVPIRSPAGVLGALYLDNRFQRARFQQTDIDVLLAFADQVAIAIHNARLHAQLAERTRELERERRRVEKLARGQAEELDRLQTAFQAQQRALEDRHEFGGIVSRSPRMRDVLTVLHRVTASHLSVLIQGESGTGKEVVARTIHLNGPRKAAAFVSVNCGALPETLLESELFGHVKGAFTGADRDRAGLFVVARGGTLFLDEVGDMPPSMQVKLLRVLQEHEVRRIGADTTERIDVRVLCATNRNLKEEVAAGRFREDLYYRLAVVEVTLPSLRERREDVIDLAHALLRRHAENANRTTAPRLSAGAIHAVLSYPWPGNVRELENVLARAMVMCDGDTIVDADLALTRPPARHGSRDRKDFERHQTEQVLSLLHAHRWNVAAVARELGMPRNTLYRKMQKFQITRPTD